MQLRMGIILLKYGTVSEALSADLADYPEPCIFADKAFNCPRI